MNFIDCEENSGGFGCACGWVLVSRSYFRLSHLCTRRRLVAAEVPCLPASQVRHGHADRYTVWREHRFQARISPTACALAWRASTADPLRLLSLAVDGLYACNYLSIINAGYGEPQKALLDLEKADTVYSRACECKPVPEDNAGDGPAAAEAPMADDAAEVERLYTLTLFYHAQVRAFGSIWFDLVRFGLVSFFCLRLFRCSAFLCHLAAARFTTFATQRRSHLGCVLPRCKVP